MKFISSLRFAIIILALIAIGAVLGTVIKQGASVEEYLSLYSEGTYRVISFLKLDDVYHAPWFYLLIVLFGVNLVLCTINRAQTLIKGTKKPLVPEATTLAAMELTFTVRDGDFDEIARQAGKGYRNVYRGPEGAVFEKGRISRYGVYLIHGSIICILAGSLIGGIWGMKGSLLLMKGETKDHITGRKNPSQEIPLGFDVLCKDFTVSFYPGGQPKDYVSTLQVRENGKTVLEREVRVNSPLQYRGYRFYQSTYGTVATFDFDIEGEKVSLKQNEVFKKNDLVLMPARFRPDIHGMGPGVLVAYVEDGDTKAQWFLKNVEHMKAHSLAGVRIHLTGMTEELYTGLEVSKDPGVFIVWVGFGAILIGLFVNFFISHRRLFVRKTDDGIIVAGFSQRNKEAFRGEFDRIVRSVNGN